MVKPMASLIYIEMCFCFPHLCDRASMSVIFWTKKRSWNRDFSAAPKSVARATARAQWDSWEPSKRCKCGTWAARWPPRRNPHLYYIYIYSTGITRAISYIYIHISILLMKNAHCPQLPSSNDVAMAGTTNKLTTSASWSWTVKPMGILLKTHGKWEIFHSYVS